MSFDLALAAWSEIKPKVTQATNLRLSERDSAPQTRKYAKLRPFYLHW